MTKRYWNIHLEEMIQARVHLGYNKRRWNPKIAPFILAGSQHTRKATHITNLVKTARFLSEACDLLFHAASQAKNILMVGTMPQKVADLVKLAAIKARCHYVSRKWLRGTLTNWLVTMLRLKNLKNLKISKKRGRFQSFRKRDASILRKKLSILQKFFGGIQYMKGLPDIVVLIDLEHEYIVLQECHLLGIPTICVIDTNCDPDLADLPIPANTKDHISIRWILNKLVLAIREGHSSYIERKKTSYIERKKTSYIERKKTSYIERKKTSYIERKKVKEKKKK